MPWHGERDTTGLAEASIVSLAKRPGNPCSYPSKKLKETDSGTLQSTLAGQIEKLGAHRRGDDIHISPGHTPVEEKSCDGQTSEQRLSPEKKRRAVIMLFVIV